MPESPFPLTPVGSHATDPFAAQDPPKPLPDHPNFGFFNRDPDDETAPIVYPLRQDDKADEIERLSAQLAAARAEFLAVYETLPVFLAERLVKLGVLLGVE